MIRFEGALTALVTPFTDDDHIDAAALKRLVEGQIAHGIGGLVLVGTTGESPTVTGAEKQRLVELTLDVVRGRVPVLLGVGTNATRSSAVEAVAARAWGIDAALVVCPYYNRPTQEGMFLHFKVIYEQAGLPIIAYNVPSRTASDLLPDTIARLAEIGAIVGVKDATANMQRAIETLALLDPMKPFAMLSGDDFTILPFVACGGIGVISVVSNLVPGDTAALVRASRAGDFGFARPLQQRLNALSRALFQAPSPIPVKAAMGLLGWCSPRLRLPLDGADERLKASLRAALEAYGSVPHPEEEER